MIIKQGDAYLIPIALRMNNTSISDKDIEVIEVFFGTVRKTYPGEITYQNGVLFYPVTQEETLALQEEKTIYMDVRVKFTNGSCIGVPEKLRVDVADATSLEVL